MLDSNTRNEIRESVRKLQPIGERFRTRFFTRLVRLAPPLAARLRQRLDGNMDLIQMALLSLDHLESEQLLDAILRELGGEVADGLAPDDLAPIGSALIGTVREFLGGEFTQEKEEAWVNFYAHLAQELERGAAGREGQ